MKITTQVPDQADSKPFQPGDRVRYNRSGELGTFMSYWDDESVVVAVDDDLFLGEQLVDTVPANSVSLVPPPPSPSVAELVDLGHRIRAERRVSASVDDLCDMFFGPEFSNEMEWNRGAR